MRSTNQETDLLRAPTIVPAKYGTPTPAKNSSPSNNTPMSSTPCPSTILTGKKTFLLSWNLKKVLNFFFVYSDFDCFGAILNKICRNLMSKAPPYEYLFSNLCFSFLSDKIVTGSFDKSAIIWDANNGDMFHRLEGHQMEIVCQQFDPHGFLVATGSMDNTAKLWDVETGKCIFDLIGHSGEIVSLHFNTDGDKLLTASFDKTAKIWDVCSAQCI